MPRPGSTTDRGYGHHHQQLREQLLPQAYGHPCPHCGNPMLPHQQLDLDHTDDRRSYRGIAHASCNRSAGARKGAAATNRRRIRTSRNW